MTDTLPMRGSRVKHDTHYFGTSCVARYCALCTTCHNLHDMTVQPQAENPSLDSFGARLAIIRWAMGWNFKEAGLACRLPQASWREWELAGRIPRNLVEIAAAISEATGFDDYWIMTGHDHKQGGGPDGQPLGPSHDPNGGLPETTKNPRPQGPGDKDGGLPRLDSNQEPFGYWPRHHLADAA